MLKKEITYEDLDGNPVTDTFYFNISKAELAKMELSQDGGLMVYLQSIVAKQDGKMIIEAFEDIIKKAYGVRSDDNRTFIKNEVVWEKFFCSDAYSVLFYELVTNATAASEFVQGIIAGAMPKTTVQELPQSDAIPAWVRENRDPTTEEIRVMSKEEMQTVFAKRLGMAKRLGSALQ